MEKEILTNKTGIKLEFKIKVNYKNGANESIFSIKPPNVNPVMPMFLGFEIKAGTIRNINIDEIRSWDLIVNEANSGLIT